MPKKTFEYAERSGSKLITQVKRNQQSLFEQIKHGCQVQRPIESSLDEWEKAHGRLEHRQYEVFEALPMLRKWQKEWPFIRQIVRCTRTRERLHSKEKPTQDIHYYVSNASLSAQNYGQYIRNHWFIENKLHHIKDVAFLEDKTIKRVNPFIFSTCIDFSLNRLKLIKNHSIRQKLYQSSLDVFKFLENNQYLNLISTP